MCKSRGSLREKSSKVELKRRAVAKWKDRSGSRYSVALDDWQGLWCDCVSSKGGCPEGRKRERDHTEESYGRGKIRGTRSTGPRKRTNKDQVHGPGEKPNEDRSAAGKPKAPETIRLQVRGKCASSAGQCDSG